MIVVAVDYSDNARAAVRWALAEAALRRCTVHAVHAVPPVSDLVLRTPEVLRMREHAGAELLAFVTEMQREAGGAVPVVPHIGAGRPADLVRDTAGDLGADLAVAGRRGLGALAAAVVGSVSRELARTSEIPLVIVPLPDQPRVAAGRVVVGVDGSEPAATALRWAAAEARRRGADLVAVHAAELFPLAPGVDPRDGTSTGLDRGSKLLDTVLDELAMETGIDAGRLVRGGAPGPVLVELAGPDDLVVVGRRGIGRVARLLLGSTTSFCVAHASCPVVVVP